jgi:RNA polymerase sigma-70 factor (ECF subfamily)
MIDQQPQCEGIADEQIVAEVLGGAAERFEILMRRYNRRLYRVAKSIVSDDSEAEDIVQDVWVRTYMKLAQFRNEARFSTWVVRIAVHEALARLRRRKRSSPLSSVTEAFGAELRALVDLRNPEWTTMCTERTAALERTIEELPAAYRAVVMLRVIEGFSVDDSADLLGLTSVNVRVRLSRAHAMMRKRLGPQFDYAAAKPFSFGGTRCNRTVACVLSRVLV